MSRIGKKPIPVPSGVSVDCRGNAVTVTGPKGTLRIVVLPEVNVSVEAGSIVVTRKDDSASTRARHGLTRALIANMVHGVSEGYEKQLEVIGVGYKSQISGEKLTLQIGFSHPVVYVIPDGVEITQDEQNKNVLIIRGADKHLVGQAAAQVRSYRPPEPYKGKGIRYRDEVVRRKVGKAAITKGE